MPFGDPCRPNCAATLTRKSPHGPVSSSMTTVRARLDRILFLNNKTLISLCLVCPLPCLLFPCAYHVKKAVDVGEELIRLGYAVIFHEDLNGKKEGCNLGCLQMMLVSYSFCFSCLPASLTSSWTKHRVSIYLILNRTSVSQREKILEKSTLNREIDQNCWMIVEFSFLGIQTPSVNLH